MFGWLSETAGLSLVVGGFFAGLGLGEGVGEDFHQQLAQVLELPVRLLVPFYFVRIGTRAQFQVCAAPAMVILLIGLCLIAFGAKILGGSLGAMKIGVLSARVLIGVSMVPRGEVVLIIASLGFNQGYLGHHAFVALVFMTIVTSVLPPGVMVPLARRHQQMIQTTSDPHGCQVEE